MKDANEKRKIKFRWKDSTGQWIHGTLMVLLNHPVVFVPEVLEKTGEVLKETLGQWTGRKSDEGQEVYEGDVVIAWDVLGDWGHTGVVQFNTRLGCYVIWDEKEVGAQWCDSAIYRVIGNIFDDPELKKKYWEVYQK